MADRSQQTEKATPQRLKKAREEGRFPMARDFVGALQFTAFVAWVGSYGAAWMDQLRIAIALLFQFAFRGELHPDSFVYLLVQIGERCFSPLVSLAATLIGITLAMTLLVTGFGFSTKGLIPDFSRLNPLPHLQQLQRQNLPGLVQAMVMLPLFSYAVYSMVRTHFAEYYNLPLQSLNAGIRVVALSLQDLLWKAAGVFLVFGCVNFFRQRRQWEGDMKMSKQEIKDESRQNDGNPQIKLRIRRLQRDLRRRNMMRDVPKATAVVPDRLVPVTFRTVLPAAGPLVTDRPVTVGAGT